MFKDIWNPTQDEIKKWAFTLDRQPDQDWQLAVYEDDNIELILELVADHSCPKRDFFVECLYVYIGDIVRIGSSERFDFAKKAIELGKKYSDEWITNWLKRSEYLMANPESYNYENWGLFGDYSRNP